MFKSTEESKDLPVLLNMFDTYSTYHNHKEAMAFSIFGLQGAFFVGLYVLGNWPEYTKKLGDNYLISLFMFTWFLFHVALRFQLRNRRLSAIIVAAYWDAIHQKHNIISNLDSEKIKFNDRYFLDNIDRFLFPIPGVLRNSDVEMNFVKNGDLIKPQTIEAYYYFLFCHKVKSIRNLNAYSYPIELISSVGSFFLLIAAIGRVLLK